MATIKGMLIRVQAMKLNDVINDAFDNTAVELAEINREQMLAGVKSDGSAMPDYSLASQEVFGKPDGPIVLKDTGAFQAAITVTREGDVLHSESEDIKNDMLIERYGQNIFGIYGPFKKKYQTEFLRPALNENINIATGLKFGK